MFMLEKAYNIYDWKLSEQICSFFLGLDIHLDLLTPDLNMNKNDLSTDQYPEALHLVFREEFNWRAAESINHAFNLHC